MVKFLMVMIKTIKIFFYFYVSCNNIKCLNNSINNFFLNTIFINYKLGVSVIFQEWKIPFLISYWTDINN